MHYTCLGVGILGELLDVSPQLYADNLKCVSTRPEQLLRAAQFTSAYVRLVGQEPAPSKCVLLSTSAATRRDMKDWVVFAQDERWTVKLDVRDLGGHLDTTYRAWGCTLAARVRAVLRVVWLVSALPLGYRGKLRILRTMYIPAALHGVSAGARGHGPVHLLVESASSLGFRWCLDGFCWNRPGLPQLPMVEGPYQHFQDSVLDALRDLNAADLC